MKSKQLLSNMKDGIGAREISAALFVLTQLTLAPFVHLARGRANLLISFITVALCLLFALFGVRNAPRERRLIATALAFTLGADYGLVLLLAENAALSMYLFNVTQICYFLFLLYSQESRRARIIHLAVRAVVLALAVTAVFLILGGDTDELSVISLIYYANLLCNTAVAFSCFRKMPFFAIGLLLFVFCDLFVGFGNLGMYFDIARDSFLYSLAYPNINIAWVFYLPSQTLIALHTASPGAEKERGC